MKQFKTKITTFSCLLFLSACGGGDSSSGNSAANVTNQCMGRETISGTSLVSIVNSCDFNINFRSVSQFDDTEPTAENNIGPGESIALELSLRLAERFILCQSPSQPNGDATECT